MEENYCGPQVEILVPVYNKTDVFVYIPSSRINSQYGQAMVDVLRRYGIISRPYHGRESKDFFST
jgi:hypothetical protein